jgi:hypothetical protein
MTDASLAAAAFGDDPGRWPLPAATTPRELWLRAVAAGGQGRYGSATADLTALRRQVPAGPLASLAHSTQASFIRQLGGHEDARRWDGRALVLAEADPEARVDALLGLAADALGMGRFASSAALLDRARESPERSTAVRLLLRRQWVAAELEMVRGNGSEAVTHAERAVELAAGHPSARHRVKTQMVFAAAVCSVGRIDEARRVAEDALSAAATLGLVPLRWALASLLADIVGDAAAAAEMIAVRDTCAQQVRRAGGVWRR